MQIMQQTGIWLSSATTDVEPLHLMDSSLPDEWESVASDSELFIRRSFETDTRLGCELLFRRYYTALCSHAVRFVGSKAIAEDLVADVFCQFYEQQIFSSITTSYRAYLYTTVRNRAFRYVRQTFRRDVSLEEAQNQETTEIQRPDSITQYEELYQDVGKAIESLPVQRRRIYLMHRFEGKKYAEIAGELGLSVRTVEVQIRLASRAIQELLKGRWLLTVLWCMYQLF